MRIFEEVKERSLKHKGINTKLPRRATKGSAGYDFYTKIPVFIPPKEKTLIFTDIKVKLEKDDVLYLHIRSSSATKKGLILKNQIGVIDSDYYSNEENDGNIGVCIENTSDRGVFIEANTRIAQGVILSYKTVDNDNVEDERTGGIGSTG